MDSQISNEDKKRIKKEICAKYVKVAFSPEGNFKYPTGRKALKILQYDEHLIANLFDAADYYCGVGNPFTLGNINAGEKVLDVGCGAGVDSLVAAMLTGPAGNVVGVDIAPDMLEKARNNLKQTGLENVSFQEISGEDLPFADETFEICISNGVINLIPDKELMLSEIFRILKPYGRLMIADQIAASNVQKDIKARLANWFQ